MKFLGLSQSQQKIVQEQFDSFCKTVLRNKSRDIEKMRKKRGEREICFSALSEKEMEQFFIKDEYPSDNTNFNVFGFQIIVRNEQLADAIASLPNDKRDILLLSYFLGMNDREIVDLMNMIKRTVQRRRCSSIKKIKEKMEELHECSE